MGTETEDVHHMTDTQSVGCGRGLSNQGLGLSYEPAWTQGDPSRTNDRVPLRGTGGKQARRGCATLGPMEAKQDCP